MQLVLKNSEERIWRGEDVAFTGLAGASNVAKQKNQTVAM
jgi:hypothetical protein